MKLQIFPSEILIVDHKPQW